MATSNEQSPILGRSGKDISREYVAKVQAYLDSGARLPVTADGSINMSALAEAVGVPRQSLYKNPAIRSLVEQCRPISAPVNTAVASEISASAGNVSDRGQEKKTKTLERRVSQLEQQNAALVAENAELRRQFRVLRLQMGREDMVIETGCRIPPPLGGHA